MDFAADATANSLRLDLATALAHGMIIVVLELRDSQGAILSQNLYWLGDKPEAYRALAELPATPIKLVATSTRSENDTHIVIRLTNTGTVVSLQNKLTLLGPGTSRILPAYYSDNYISLLPGESRTVTVEYPSAAAKGPASIALRGWNSVPQTITAAGER